MTAKGNRAHAHHSQEDGKKKRTEAMQAGHAEQNKTKIFIFNLYTSCPIGTGGRSTYTRTRVPNKAFKT